MSILQVSAQQRSTSAPWGIGHNNEIEIEVPILKEANAETLGNSASMHTRLPHSKYGLSCGRSCRKGRLMSINTKDGGQGGDDQSANKVQAPITLLMCFCQLGGSFDTDVFFQDSGHLVDGSTRNKK